jgi:hypothetical protein
MYALYAVPALMFLIFKAILLDQKFPVWKENDKLFSAVVYISVKCCITGMITSIPANHYRVAAKGYQMDILKTVTRLSYIK